MKLLNSAIINEFTMLTYRRPLGKDDQYDSAIVTNQSQSIIWAMGPINNKVGTGYPIWIVTKVNEASDVTMFLASETFPFRFMLEMCVHFDF